MVKKITTVILSLIVFILFFSLQNIYSAECDDKTGNDRINCLDALVKSGEQKVNSLESEKQLLDNKAYLIGLLVKETEAKIESTQKEMDILGTRIEGLDQSLDYLSKQLIQRIIEGYKKKPLTVFSLLLDSRGASDFLNQVKYLKTAQNNNQKLYYF
jgi:peptidoglycan hydrolase CwlO-like protein